MTPNELRAAMQQLPEPVTDKQPPFWEFWRWELWDHVVNGDDPETFLAWPCIGHTMLHLHWPDLVMREYKMLVEDDNMPDYSAPTLTSYSLEQEQVNIRQAFHLRKWEQVTGKRIADLDSIVEIGGGYGAACLMARKMGFKGKYTIYDLSEFSLLQQYYLSQAGVENVNFITTLPDPEMYPNRIILADLMIAIYSMSEIHDGTRKDILGTWYLGSFLSLYSGTWAGHDNKSWFEYTLRCYGFPNVFHEEALHHNDRDNWYSIGW